MDQPLFDSLADELVEMRQEVSYATIREALAARNREPGEPRGKAASNRDLKGPYKDWRDRRGYKKHLTVLELSESMEKLLASFTREAMVLAAASAVADKEKKALKLASASLEDAQEELAERTAQLDALAKENRRLTKEVEALRAAGRRSSGGKKPRGIPASTAYHFWDRVARRVAAVIRKGKEPMTIHQLVEALDEDTKMLAKAAFAPINATVLANRLADRVKYNRYRLDKVGDRYLLRKREDTPAPASRAA